MKTELTLHGAVKIRHSSPNDSTALSAPLPAIRIRFYESNGARSRGGYLGETETGPDGRYSFQLAPHLREIIATFLQFTDEVWAEITETRNNTIFTVTVNMGESDMEATMTEKSLVHMELVTLGGTDMQHEFVLPVHCSVERRPDIIDPRPMIQSFQFLSIGVLPMDAAHISFDGYASASPQQGDLITLNRQPFGGTLRISVRFTDMPAVYSYAIEIAQCDSLGVPIGSYRPLTDRLTNQQWSTPANRWIQTCLGPDPKLDGRYRNVDNDPGVWYEKYLKACWVTTGLPDASYRLRIRGFDSGGQELFLNDYPSMLCISNTPPKADLVALRTGLEDVDKCGCAKLNGPNRDITFSVTATHPLGHVAVASLSGTRGPTGDQAGSTVAVPLPPVATNLPDNTPVKFTVKAPSPCRTLAYGFLFQVYGSATDCRSQYILGVTKRSNLIVTEVD